MALHFGQQAFDRVTAHRQDAPVGFQPVDREDEQSLKTGALVFLDAIDAASLPLEGQHELLRVPIDDAGVNAIQMVCSCGWVSLPVYDADDVAGTTCTVYEAERERNVRARSIHAVRARQVLLRLIASLRG